MNMFKMIGLMIIVILCSYITLAETFVNVSAATNKNLTMNVNINANKSEVNIDGVNWNKDYARTKKTVSYFSDSKPSWHDLVELFTKTTDRLEDNQLELREAIINFFIPRAEVFHYFSNFVNDLQELWLQQKIIEEKVNLLSEDLGYNITALDKKATLTVMVNEDIKKLTRNNITYYKMSNKGEFVSIE